MQELLFLFLPAFLIFFYYSCKPPGNDLSLLSDCPQNFKSLSCLQSLFGSPLSLNLCPFPLLFIGLLLHSFFFFITFILGQDPHFHHLHLFLENMHQWMSNLRSHRASVDVCPLLPSQVHLQLHCTYLVSIFPLRASGLRVWCLCLESLDFHLHLEPTRDQEL